MLCFFWILNVRREWSFSQFALSFGDKSVWFPEVLKIILHSLEQLLSSPLVFLFLVWVVPKYFWVQNLTVCFSNVFCIRCFWFLWNLALYYPATIYFQLLGRSYHFHSLVFTLWRLKVLTRKKQVFLLKKNKNQHSSFHLGSDSYRDYETVE